MRYDVRVTLTVEADNAQEAESKVIDQLECLDALDIFNPQTQPTTEHEDYAL